jgi:hypothetical protein
VISMTAATLRPHELLVEFGRWALPRFAIYVATGLIAATTFLVGAAVYVYLWPVSPSAPPQLTIPNVPTEAPLKIEGPQAQPTAPAKPGRQLPPDAYGPEQSDVNVVHRAGFYVDENGKVRTIDATSSKVDAKGHAMIKKYGKKVPRGTVIYRDGDNVYVVDPTKLAPDTKQTLTDHARGWVDDD